MTLSPGQTVYHPTFGAGRVLSLKPGLRATVRFDREPDMPRTVDLGGLDVEDDSGDEGHGLDAGPDGTQASAAAPLAIDLDARQATEALRLGVTPNACLRECTVAREEAIDSMARLLEEGAGLRLVFGDYGSGKTHLLEIYERLALDAGYVTARVVMAPSTVPPTHPQKLYAAIVDSLRYPGSMGRRLEPVFDRLRGSPRHVDPQGARYSRFFSPALHVHDLGDDVAIAWMSDWLDGYPMDMEEGKRLLRRARWTGHAPLTFSNYRTYGRMYVHLLGTLAAWLADAGWKGLVLLLDEVEKLDELQDSVVEYAREVLRHIAAATLRETSLAFDPQKLYRGGHQVHRDIPLRFDEAQPLIAVYAMTPLEEIRALAKQIVNDSEVDVEIAPLSRADYRKISDNVCAVYRRAHPDFPHSDAVGRELDELTDRLLGEGVVTPRSVIRHVVGRLDRFRFEPAS